MNVSFTEYDILDMSDISSTKVINKPKKSPDKRKSLNKSKIRKPGYIFTLFFLQKWFKSYLSD